MTLPVLAESSNPVSFRGLFDGEPEFVNELGVKWWRDEHTTDYARRPDANGISLDAVCFGIEEPGGRRTRVLVSMAREIIEEDQSLESLAVKIDVRKMLKLEHLKMENPK